jgi:hypothetical protein
MCAVEGREDGALAPRPYLTIGGAILFWVGMLCQFVPFCNILGLIFPGLDMFQGLCFVFVIIGTLILAASTFLFIIGLCWSCTRGWAALTLIIIALRKSLCRLLMPSFLVSFHSFLSQH